MGTNGFTRAVLAPMLFVVAVLSSGCATSSRYFWEQTKPVASASSLRAKQYAVKFRIENDYKLRAHAPKRYPNMFTDGHSDVIPIDVAAGHGIPDKYIPAWPNIISGLSSFPLLSLPRIIIPEISRADVGGDVGISMEPHGKGLHSESLPTARVAEKAESRVWYSSWFSPVGFIPVPGKARIRGAGYERLDSLYHGRVGFRALQRKVESSDEWLNYVVDVVATELAKNEPEDYANYFEIARGKRGTFKP